MKIDKRRKNYQQFVQRHLEAMEPGETLIENPDGTLTLQMANPDQRTLDSLDIMWLQPRTKRDTQKPDDFGFDGESG